MLFTLATRNIFRNKRRTLITIGAVAFAVFLSSVTLSFQRGVWDSVIDNSVNMFFGFIQIHDNGYWDEQTIDNSLYYDKALADLPNTVSEIKGIAPRIESLALASSEQFTQGVMVVGIDPEKENALTGISEKVIEGKYLDINDKGALVASGVAQKLKLKLGDTLVLISQGYHGANAAGKFPILGIFKFALPDLNKRLVYLPLPVAQYFYAAEDRVTTLALKLTDKDDIPKAMKVLNKSFDSEHYEIMDYKKLMPELVQARKLDDAGNYIILGILYVLITFAIFGTILMMTKERSYEFGVLTAIGMKRFQLFGIVFLENVVVGLMGAIVGILMSIPVVYYLYKNPLDMSGMGEEAVAAYEKFGMNPVFPAAFDFNIFLGQAILIFIITCILGIYPFLKIMRLKPMEAMRD